jgi:hypothetical protein
MDFVNVESKGIQANRGRTPLSIVLGVFGKYHTILFLFQTSL